MTLYDECKTALGNHFQELNNEALQYAINLLNRFPIVGTGIIWEKIQFLEYHHSIELLQAINDKKIIGYLSQDDSIFVFADNMDYPIFQSNLRSALENFDDITALSPVTFLFNKKYIIQRLFPYELIRIGILYA